MRLFFVIMMIGLCGCKQTGIQPDDPVCVKCHRIAETNTLPKHIDTTMWMANAIYYVKDMRGMMYDCKITKRDSNRPR
jgi:hypothetical protein